MVLTLVFELIKHFVIAPTLDPESGQIPPLLDPDTGSPSVTAVLLCNPADDKEGVTCVCVSTAEPYVMW